MRYFKIALLLLIIFGKYSFSQNIYFTYKYLTSKTIYSICQEKYNKIKIPSQKVTGFNIPIKSKLVIGNIDSLGIILWEKEFDQPLNIIRDSTFLNIAVFTKNIANYYIILSSNGRKVFQKEVCPYSNSLYSQNELSLKNFSLSLNEIHQGSIKNYKIDKLIIIVKPKRKKYSFIVSELLLSKIVKEEKKINNPFFDLITGSNSLKELQNNSLCPEKNKELVLLADYFYYGDLNTQRCYIKSNNADIINKDLIDAVFKKIFEYYPHYSTTNFKKDEILNWFNLLNQNSAISYRCFLDSLKQKIAQFNDPHFKVFSMPKDSLIKVNSKLPRTNPFPIEEINNVSYIVAVFDTSIKKISPGDRILYCEYKSEEYKKNLKTNNTDCIKNLSDTILIYTINQYNDTVATTYNYNKINIYIPENYRPKDCAFKLIKDIAYFKINEISDQTYLNFEKYFSDFKKSKGIIFDLRNSPGGNGTISSMILSHFINHPVITNHTTIIGLPDYKESLVIKPNRDRYIDKPVCILINNRTACGAEFFSYLMKVNTKTVLVGASSTAGAIATILDIIFPDEFGCRIDCFAKEEIYPNINIENIGISPDIWVKINSVSDLYPYDDKILQTALKYLEYY